MDEFYEMSKPNDRSKWVNFTGERFALKIQEPVIRLGALDRLETADVLTPSTVRLSLF
jgi:hypothetical protein